jgi:hypothetical protein
MRKSITLNTWEQKLHNNNNNVSSAIKHRIHTGKNGIMVAIYEYIGFQSCYGKVQNVTYIKQ